MNPHIYCFFDKTKKVIIYVGKTNGRDKNYRTGSKILQRYISIYGYQSFDSRFDRQILECCDITLLNDREEFYIKKYKTLENGVNLTAGGKYDLGNRQPILKPILQFDLKGNFIKEWKYVKEPVIEGVCSDYNGISACCIGKGKQKTSGGYMWRFKDDFEIIPDKIKPQKRKKYKKRVGGGGAIPVTINGVTYNSKKECMDILNIPQSKLKKILKSQNFPL